MAHQLDCWIGHAHHFCSVSLGGSEIVTSAKALFEAELNKRKVKYSGPDSEGLYKVDVNGLEVTVSLENISRNYERDKDPEIVLNFINQTLNEFEAPPWEKAKSLVFFSAEPSDHNFGDTIHYKVSEDVSKVLVLTDLNEGKITWISSIMIKDWEVSKEEVERHAITNMAALLKGKQPEVNEIDGQKLGMIPIHSVFKASTIFAPNFKEFISEEVGWPVYAVIPCRDFIYVLPEKDKTLLNRMGGVVQKEYRTSGYPITTEVFKISDNGIEAIGKYPE